MPSMRALLVARRQHRRSLGQIPIGVHPIRPFARADRLHDEERAHVSEEAFE
jgi:hypothetical protein